MQLFLKDRAGGKSKLPPDELHRRRSLFWELLHLDARLVGVNISLLKSLELKSNSRYRLEDLHRYLLIMSTVPDRHTLQTVTVSHQKAVCHASCSPTLVS